MQNDRKIRVAVASSDGIVVNSHFGRARDFYIYEVSENEDTVLLEKRELVPICEAGHHDAQRRLYHSQTGECRCLSAGVFFV